MEGNSSTAPPPPQYTTYHNNSDNYGPPSNPPPPQQQNQYYSNYDAPQNARSNVRRGNINWCGIWCMAITFFLFHLLTLVWPVYFTVTTILFLVLFFSAVYGFSPNSIYYVRPFMFLSFSLLAFSTLMIILTWSDYHQKCTNHKNLDERTTQNAYQFDCEGDAIGLVLWSIGAVIYIIITIILCVVIRASYSDVFYEDTNLLLNSQNITNESQRHKWHVGSTIFSLLVVIAVLITTCVVSFNNRSKPVDGICPAGSPEGYFKEPETNDLGCCEWLKKEGTCCQQQGCDLKPSYVFSNMNDDPRCKDLLGLLSCSYCRKDSGNFVINAFGSLRMCQPFCNQLYQFCSSSTGGNSTLWCEQEFSNFQIVPVVSGQCFNSASALNINWSMLVCLAILLINFLL